MVKVDIYFSSQIKRTMLTHHIKEKIKEKRSVLVSLLTLLAGCFSECE